MYNLKKILLNSDRENALNCLKPEYVELANSWRGMSPSAVGRLICREYTCRFIDPYRDMTNSNSYKCNIPFEEIFFSPLDNTWLALRDRVRFAKRMRKTEHEISSFWECILDVLRYLSNNENTKRRRHFRQKNINEGKIRVDSKIENSFCRVCWRMTYGDFINDSKPCHLHKGKSRDEEYRHRWHIKAKCNININGDQFNLMQLYSHIVENIESKFGVYYKDNVIRADEDGEFLYYTSPHFEGQIKKTFIEMDFFIRNFPYVQKKLEELGTNINAFWDVIEQLESPPKVGEEPENYRNVRYEFYDLLRWSMPTAVRYFAMAEAWFMMEEAHPWGGSRNGAGRKTASSDLP